DIPQNLAVLSREDVLYFESQNPADLKEKLEYAFSHPELMAEKAQRTKEKVEQEYAVSRVVEQYVDLYNQHLPSSPQLARA
ncbi:MAG: glycosyltransferase, partial [Bacteroidota bacterium]